MNWTRRCWHDQACRFCDADFESLAISRKAMLCGLLASEPWAFDVLEAKPRIAAADLNHLAMGLETFEHWGDRNALEWFFCLPTAIRHFIGRLYADAGKQNSEAACPVKPLSDFRSKEEAIAWLRNYSKPRIAKTHAVADSAVVPIPSSDEAG